MFERFTGQAVRVVMFAQEEARRLGHNFVGTEMILLGLIREDSGVAGRALRFTGLKFEDLREEVEKKIGYGSGKVAAEIPFTPQAKRLLERGWHSSRLQGAPHVGTEHLLLGLVGLRDGVGCYILNSCNADLAAIHDKIYQISELDFGDLAGLLESELPFDWLTDESAKVMVRAQKEAELLGRDTVGTEHLLLGLLAPHMPSKNNRFANNSIARRALNWAGLDLSTVRTIVASVFGTGNSPPKRALTFTPNANRLLNLSAESCVMQNDMLGTGYILLAILEQKDTKAQRVLSELEVNSVQLTQHTRSLIELQRPKSTAGAWSRIGEMMSGQKLENTLSVLSLKHVDSVRAVMAVADAHHNDGDFARAERLYERALRKAQIDATGTASPESIAIVSNLALVCMELKKHSRAEELLSSVSTDATQLMAENRNYVWSAAGIFNLLGWNLSLQGKHLEAKAKYEKALELFSTGDPQNHTLIASIENNLGNTLRQLQSYDQAEEMLCAARQKRQGFLSSAHRHLASSFINLGRLYLDQGKLSEAEAEFKHALELLESTLFPKHPHIADLLRKYAEVLRRTERNEEADQLEQRAASINAYWN